MKILPNSMPVGLVAALFSVMAISAGAVEVPSLTPMEAAALVAEGKAVLVDVREPAEWEETGVAAPAVLLAKSDFDGEKKEWTPFLESVGDKQVILYCRSGRRAGAIGDALAHQGFKVANARGLTDWKEAGLPTRAPDEPAAAPGEAH